MIEQLLPASYGRVHSLQSSCRYDNDPLALYQTLCQQQHHNLLLESAEIHSKHNEKSLLLIDAALMLECRDNKVTVQALTANGQNALTFLRQQCPSTTITHADDAHLCLHYPDNSRQALDEDSRLKQDNAFTPLRLLTRIAGQNHPFSVFLGGIFGYDMLACYESLPTVNDGENRCPDYLFYLAETLLIIDHRQQQCQLLGNVFSGPDAGQCYFSLAKRVGEIKAIIDSPLRHQLPTLAPVNASQLNVDIDDHSFAARVKQLKHHIRAGDVFQVVPSRTFSLPLAHSLPAYARLRQQNPSPYMFYLRHSDFELFGASPESALKYSSHNRQVEVYPIAGTRPRGKTPDQDSRIELALRNDAKERAEHLMLVDLARNDIARVAQPGSKYVAELLKVDRYSHVMHLVSRVVGTLRDDLDALHAYQARMNMGTLVGAPKLRAAELIRQYEGKRRGSYGGAVGYLNGQGDMDSCIVIRSAFVRNGTAYIQAGAGVVQDSDPMAEAEETRHKAQAVIRAIMGGDA